MLRFSAAFIAAGIGLCVTGCKPSSRLPKSANDAYGKIELGMSIDDARELIAGHSEWRPYDILPADPKPREIYYKLPSTTEWRAWAATGKPTLILGVVHDTVVFRQFLWLEGGEFKSDTMGLPEYQ